MGQRYKKNRTLGQLDVAGINTLLSEASFSVVPSEWYENNPLSVIESLSAGTPVAGAAIGGIPELIGDGDGILFEPGNADSLHRAITTAAETAWDHDVPAFLIKDQPLSHMLRSTLPTVGQW